MVHLSERLGTTVSMERFEVRGLNRLHVEGLYVADYHGDTLLYVPRVSAPVVDLGLTGRPIAFGRVEMTGAVMHIHRDSTGAVNIREIVRTARAMRRKPKNPDFHLTISGIAADSLTFALTRDDRPHKPVGVDFSQFIIRNTTVEIDRLAVVGSDIFIDIAGLNFVERTGWPVSQLTGELHVGRGVVELEGVHIDSEGSTLNLPRVGLRGADWQSFRHFADSVELDIAVEGSRVSDGFLSRFVPAAAGRGVGDFSVSASVEGTLATLGGRIDELRVEQGRLAAQFSSRGLPDVQNADFEGVISLLSLSGGELAMVHPALGGEATRVDFAGTFQGSVADGIEVEGDVTATEIELGKLLNVKELGAVDGEFAVTAVAGKSPSVKARGTVRNGSFGNRSIGDISLDGGWARGAFSATVEARDPMREWGLRGDLTATLNGSTDELEVEAEFRNALYISPRGSVATPQIELSAHLSADEKRANIRSLLADADVRIVGEKGTAEVAIKNVPGLQMDEGNRARIDFDTERRLANVDFDARFVEYRGILLTDAHLTASGGADDMEARLTARDLYSGSFHLSDPTLMGSVRDGQTRLSLDGERWLTVNGLTLRGMDDTVRVDLRGLDLAMLGEAEIDGHVELLRGGTAPQIDADVTIENLDVALLQPLLGEAVNETAGRADIALQARGGRGDLRLDGTAMLRNFALTVGFTGVRYSIDSARVEVKNSIATLASTAVRDRFGGTGELSGEVDLRDRKIAFRAEPSGLLAFDRSGGGALSGRVFASGEVELRSDGAGMTLEIAARTDPQTAVQLPLSAKSGIEWADFVTFAAPSPPPDDSLSEVESRRAAYMRNVRSERRNPLTLNLTLDVTRDAEVGLIIDPRLGRGITARGEGVISLGLDPATRALSVTGDYTIAEGRMELSMMDVLNKNFTIAPGSAIRWSGSADDATLDVKALYRVRTSLAPLLGDGNAMVSERANVPVDCVLRLRESLSAPAVTFDIEFPSADADQRVIAAGAMNTEELKSMQFLSLLVTGNFAGAGSIAASTGASTEALASGSVGFDILTNQLGNLLSSDDYNVYFRYRPEDNFLTNRLDMGFQAGFARDRLQLEIEGNYVDDRAAASLGTHSGGVNNLAGDVSLTWVIDRGGNLRLKVFSQTIDRLNETQGLQESGLGVYWQKDFDRFRDIFRRKNLTLPSKTNRTNN